MPRSSRYAFALSLAIVPFFGQTLAAQNQRADAAKKAYQAAIKAARQEYLKQVTLAIKEATDAGDRTEMKQLREQKEILELDSGNVEAAGQVQLAAKYLENTVWRTKSNPKGFLRLLPGNRTINHAGTRGVWIMTDKTTALTQSGSTGHIYVFRFQPDLKSAAVHKFKDDNMPRPFFRR